MLRLFGITLATALTTTSVIGIGALILRDFSEVPIAIMGAVKWLSSEEEPAPDDLFTEVDLVTLFMTTPIEGTSIDVSTGAAFVSQADLVARRPGNMWCYVQVGDDNVHRKITLGTKASDEAPAYTDLPALPAEVQNALNMDADALMQIARTHCRFADFDPRASQA